MISNILKKEILKKIKPNSKEKQNNNKIVNELIKKLNIDNNEKNFIIFIGGSFAKDTYLKNDFDVDLFIQFQNQKLTDIEMSNEIENILKNNKLNYTKEKGSRNYFSLIFKNIKFELVPTSKIKKNEIQKFKNSTDLSIYHVNYIKDYTKKIKGSNDEIRLTKQFFKANGFYGAESYIKGFSGHSIDLLLVYYKTLSNFLENSKNWERQNIIDIEKSYNSKKEVLKNIEKDKHSSLIIVDSVIKNRNASRALSQKNYFKFILFCQNLTKLKKENFQIKKENYELLKKQNLTFAKSNDLKSLIIEIDFKFFNSSKDIIGAKLLKINEKIKKNLESFGFKFFENQFKIDFKKEICLNLFLIETDKISKFQKIKGPSIFLKEATQKFIEKRGLKNITLENENLFFYNKIKKTNLKDYINFNIKNFEILTNNKLEFIKKIKVELK